MGLSINVLGDAPAFRSPSARFYRPELDGLRFYAFPASLPATLCRLTAHTIVGCICLHHGYGLQLSERARQALICSSR